MSDHTITPEKVNSKKKKKANLKDPNRSDGWANLMTGVGLKGTDKRLSNVILENPQLFRQEVENLYHGDGIAKRIIDLPTNEMTRQSFEINKDTDGEIKKYMNNSFKAERMVHELLRQGKLYGGAIGVLNIDDGLDPIEPVSVNTIRGITSMQVFDRFIADTSESIDRNPFSPTYLMPEWYRVAGLDHATFTVHKSRVVRIDGAKTGTQVFIKNNYWSDSDLKAPFERIRAVASVCSSSEIIVEDFTQVVLGIKNLGDIIARGGEKQLRTRLNLIDFSRHVLNAMLIDSDGETYDKKSTSIAGLDKLMERFTIMLSAVTGIPATLLMGTSPKGLNAAGAVQGDIRFWYDNLASIQPIKLTPVWDRLIELSLLSKDSGLSFNQEDLEVNYNPLWQLSEAEEAERRDKVADTDKTYIEAGVLSAVEIRESRWGGDQYSSEIVLGNEPRQEGTKEQQAELEKIKQMMEAKEREKNQT